MTEDMGSPLTPLTSRSSELETPSSDDEGSAIGRNVREVDVKTRMEVIWATHGITKPRSRNALSERVIRYLDAYIRTRDDLNPTDGEYATFAANLATAEAERYIKKRNEKRMGTSSIASSHTVGTPDVMGREPLDKGKYRETGTKGNDSSPQAPRTHSKGEEVMPQDDELFRRDHMAPTTSTSQESGRFPAFNRPPPIWLGR
jgi:hypothetical protein